MSDLLHTILQQATVQKWTSTKLAHILYLNWKHFNTIQKNFVRGIIDTKGW